MRRIGFAIQLFGVGLPDPPEEVFVVPSALLRASQLGNVQQDRERRRGDNAGLHGVVPGVNGFGGSG